MEVMGLPKSYRAVILDKHPGIIYRELRAIENKFFSKITEEYWTCSITRLVIEQVLAKCSAFCCFLVVVV
jgi:hypothetical protein